MNMNIFDGGISPLNIKIEIGMANFVARRKGSSHGMGMEYLVVLR